MNPSTLLDHDWFPRPLPDNVIIGPRSWLYSSYAFLHYQSQRPCGVHIGSDTGIYHGTFFDLGPQGQIKIGNYCTLVGAIINTNSCVMIGDYSFIAHEVTLADRFDATPWQPTSAPPGDGNAETLPATISLGENCWIGARAILLAGAHIGSGAIVGAAAVVDFEVPPFAIVAGNPARVVGSADRKRTDPVRQTTPLSPILETVP
jgi:acetyltransferase-like isoleucine patch superfamily enzyme